jgi:hypothetical protein
MAYAGSASSFSGVAAALRGMEAAAANFVPPAEAVTISQAATTYVVDDDESVTRSSCGMIHSIFFFSLIVLLHLVMDHKNL